MIALSVMISMLSRSAAQHGKHIGNIRSFFTSYYMGELMRNLKITVVVDRDLRAVLEAGAEREGRSVSNYSYRLLDRAAREAVRAQPVEQQPTAAA
jgi:hypothetical protein